MKKSFILILSVLCFASLCGCGGYKEPDGRYTVAALGISKGENYRIIAETVSIGTDNATADPRIFVGEGKTLKAAFCDVNSMFSKEIMLDHCAAVVMENSVGENGEILKYLLSLGLNPSACTVRTEDVADLLSAVPERSAVGYDIMGIVRREKLDGCRLFRILSGDLVCPEFIKNGDAVGVMENGKQKK